jgi:hypothetical protein
MAVPKLTSAALQRLKREEEMAQRNELIRKARAGDAEAQRILSEPPYRMRVYSDKEIEAVEAKSKK